MNRKIKSVNYFTSFGLLNLILSCGFIITPEQTLYGSDATNVTGLAIGNTYQGGIIFLVDTSGKHGLITAKKILNTGKTRKDQSEINIFARVDGTSAGRKNTMILTVMRTGEGINTFAAKTAAEYSVQNDGITPCSSSKNAKCYSGWRLPSRYELNLMYQNLNKAGIPGFSFIHFLSSRDLDTKDPWELHEFDDTNPYSYDNKNIYVRVIRSF